MTLDDEHRPRARRHPERRAARAAVALRRDLPAAAHRRPRGRARAGAAAASRSSMPGRPSPSRRTTPGSPWRSPTTAWRRSACRRRRWTASRRSSGRAWRRARPSSATSARAAPPTGRSRSARRTSTSRSRPVAGRRAARRPSRERARRAHAELPGVEVIWRQDCYQLPTGRTSFGFKDGIGQPAVEGSGRPATNPQEPPLKAGEIILGYPDETGELPPMPTPDVLGRNGTYVVFRKLHTRVAAYRQYLRAKAASREEEALLGAKMVGPLAERRAARARPRAGRSRARRRPGAQQRLRLRRRPRAASSARPARTRGGRTRATRSTTRAASTSACTA